MSDLKQTIKNLSVKITELIHKNKWNELDKLIKIRDQLLVVYSQDPSLDEGFIRSLIKSVTEDLKAIDFRKSKFERYLKRKSTIDKQLESYQK